MAKTLLNGVNEVLKKASLLDSDVGVLSSLTDSGRQSYIDTAVQALNECVDDLYVTLDRSKPLQLTSSTITLVTDTRTYALASDLNILRPEYHLIDRTNSHTIYWDMDEDAYRQLITQDLEQDDTGLPSIATVSPETGYAFFDRAPTSAHNGNVYTYYYDKDLELTVAADTFPFENVVFRPIVSAAYERFVYLDRKEFNASMYTYHMAAAARAFRKIPQRSSWGRNAGAGNSTDPLQP